MYTYIHTYYKGGCQQNMSAGRSKTGKQDGKTTINNTINNTNTILILVIILILY